MQSRVLARGRRTRHGVAFQPVEQPRLYVAVARQIAQQIREAPLKPGTQLPAERDLAQQFQVSRTTLREAIIALETMGMVEVRVGDGTYVTGRGSRKPSLRWEGKGDPGPGPHEQFRVRALVECAAAQDAAVNITDDELEVLAELLASMERNIDGPTAESDRRNFHATVARASRNSILADLILDLWEMRSSEMWQTIRSRAARPEHHVDALNDRRMVYEALRRRDGSAAGAAMARLMERIRERYFSALEE